MKLSNRLQTVASFVNKGSNIVDIGTDHGYIPIYLIEKGVIDSAIAMDVGKGPLNRAREHVLGHGLADKISLRLSDGLDRLHPSEADTAIIAGMGGELVIHILDRGVHVLPAIDTLILSPQSELYKVRQYLQDHGYRIMEETMITEDGKFYTVIKAEKGIMNYEKHIYFKYGKYLINKKHPILKKYLEQEERQLRAVLATLKNQSSEGVQRRVLELKEELSYNKEAQYEM